MKESSSIRMMVAVVDVFRIEGGDDTAAGVMKMPV